MKITAIDNEHRRTLVLEGRLVDPWIAELDLKDVTAISQRGENLLFQMMADGATFNCCRGVLTKHVLQQVERRRETHSRKVGNQ